MASDLQVEDKSPVIDNVSMVDFLKRRGRDKSKINVFPAATLTKNAEGKQMTEFGLLKRKGIIGGKRSRPQVASSRCQASSGLEVESARW